MMKMPAQAEPGEAGVLLLEPLLELLERWLEEWLLEERRDLEEDPLERWEDDPPELPPPE